VSKRKIKTKDFIKIFDDQRNGDRQLFKNQKSSLSPFPSNKIDRRDACPTGIE